MSWKITKSMTARFWVCPHLTMHRAQGDALGPTCEYLQPVYLDLDHHLGLEKCYKSTCIVDCSRRWQHT